MIPRPPNKEVKIVIMDADRYRNEELKLARLLNDGWILIGMCGLTPLTFVVILERDRRDTEYPQEDM